MHWFCSTSFVIGLVNAALISNKGIELNKLLLGQGDFSFSQGDLHVFALFSHWSHVISSFDLIGLCDYLDLSVTKLNRKTFHSIVKDYLEVNLRGSL